MKIFVLSVLVSGLVLADDGGLLHCRAIADATARLACYDAMAAAARGSGPSSAGSNAGQTSTLPAPRAQLPVEQSAPQRAQQQFGLEGRAANNEVLDAIETTIPGKFEGWSAKSTFRLANGQVWQVSDDSARAHYIDDPKVRIRRGALGAFYLEIQGTNVSPRVKRLQ